MPSAAEERVPRKQPELLWEPSALALSLVALPELLSLGARSQPGCAWRENVQEKDESRYPRLAEPGLRIGLLSILSLFCVALFVGL